MICGWSVRKVPHRKVGHDWYPRITFVDVFQSLGRIGRWCKRAPLVKWAKAPAPQTWRGQKRRSGGVRPSKQEGGGETCE
jgi:hypothetical protein